MRREPTKEIISKLIRCEQGQALLLVLVLMVIGGLIIGPLLTYMSTGLKLGKQVYEEKTASFYAADSGVEDALWRIRNDELPEWMKATWDDAVYDHDQYTYSTPQINGKDVNIEIQPIWALDGLGSECLGDNPPEGKTPHQDIVTVGDLIGYADGNGLYQISISYDQSQGNLKVEKIGGMVTTWF